MFLAFFGPCVVYLACKVIKLTAGFYFFFFYHYSFLFSEGQKAT